MNNAILFYIQICIRDHSGNSYAKLIILTRQSNNVITRKYAMVARTKVGE